MRKILIIDDKPDNLVSISALLKYLIPDCDISVCLSGIEGLRKARTDLPDTILLDIHMPEMDGYEVCRRLKQDEATQSIPVIMLTAVKTDSESRIRGLEIGADAFLTKPIDETELAAQVKVALRIKKAEDQLRKKNALLEEMVRQRTRSLKETEESFRKLVENSLIGISVIRKGRILYQNPEHRRIMAALFQALDREDYRSIHPDDLENVIRFRKKAWNMENGNEDIQFRFYPSASTDRSGEMTWVQCRMNPIRYAGENSVLFYVIDVTRAKSLESMILIADKMQSLGRVATGIVHEIRNPLSSISMEIYLLRKAIEKSRLLEKTFAKEAIDCVNDIESAFISIDAVMQRVMDFSRPHHPELKPENVNRTIEAAIRLSQATLKGQGIEIETFFDECLPESQIDGQLISQVIMNLMNNAADAMKTSTKRRIISIRTAPMNGCISIRIKDSGTGIPSEIQDKIFDPFFTTKKTGTGIGLSICHRIIGDHCGSLQFVSDGLNGTEFQILLPVQSSNGNHPLPVL